MLGGGGGIYMSFRLCFSNDGMGSPVGASCRMVRYFLISGGNPWYLQTRAGRTAVDVVMTSSLLFWFHFPKYEMFASARAPSLPYSSRVFFCRNTFFVRFGALPSAHVLLPVGVFVSVQSNSLSEALDLSGILAVFFCGLTLSHYAWHSLGENAQVCCA